MDMVVEHKIATKLPLLQKMTVEDKVVLLRVDHNVVKGGKVQDPYRIDQTIGTIFNIVERGGRPIIMTHVGRPRDKETGKIKIEPSTSVKPIVEYLENKLHTKIFLPNFKHDTYGIENIDTSVNLAIKKLKNKELGAIYLPNTRWFKGEEGIEQKRKEFAIQLAGLADVFVNDAFGSWQPHVSTYEITQHLPSFAGYLMQQEILNLYHVLEPTRPFVAVVAGAKFNTKIKPLYKIYNKVDNLILGGIIYNTYLCAKYGVKIKGISNSDLVLAQELVEMDKGINKILELPYVYESDTLEGKIDGKFRIKNVQEFKPGMNLKYILDIAQKSFEDPVISETLNNAKTIFVNAVMGYTPHFIEGSIALDRKIDQNLDAKKLYGGGDTLKEFKDLCPGLYLSVLDNSNYHFFTGGGTVLKAIEAGNPYSLEPVNALIKNGGK
jgi:phosphoglycerate kinase